MVIKTMARPVERAPVPAKRIVAILEACCEYHAECEACSMRSRCIDAWDKLCSEISNEGK
jgi:hypothetical protein